MRITIDENGNIDPPNSADLLAVVPQEWSKLPEGDAVPDSADVIRTFQCRAHDHIFEARSGQVTVHACPPE